MIDCRYGNDEYYKTSSHILLRGIKFHGDTTFYKVAKTILFVILLSQIWRSTCAWHALKVNSVRSNQLSIWYRYLLNRCSVFYWIGYKKDIWYAVDPLTGTKTQTLTMDGAHNVCPSSTGTTIFIGRTGKNYKIRTKIRMTQIKARCTHIGILLWASI